MEAFLIVVIVLLVLIAIIIISHIRIVPQTNAYVVERLGRYHATWDTGIHFLVPFIDRIAVDPNAATTYAKSKSYYSPYKIGIVNLKEQVIDFEPQPVITKETLRCKSIP